ncbi:MAG: hypothetical protein V1651_04080 [Patescibacteria group bacterium]
MNTANPHNQIAIFQGKLIRKTIFQKEWWFSVVDVIEALTDSSNPRIYWGVMKKRMDDFELILTMLGERTTTEIHRANNLKGVPKLKNDARVGGQIAGSARKQIERKIGRSVVSEKNFLNSQNLKKIKK